MDGQPLTYAHCHGVVLAAFLSKLLKNDLRASSIGSETSPAKVRNWKLRSHGAFSAGGLGCDVRQASCDAGNLFVIHFCLMIRCVLDIVYSRDS
jgi:hypothetical protein